MLSTFPFQTQCSLKTEGSQIHFFFKFLVQFQELTWYRQSWTLGLFFSNLKFDSFDTSNTLQQIYHLKAFWIQEHLHKFHDQSNSNFSDENFTFSSIKQYIFWNMNLVKRRTKKFNDFVFAWFSLLWLILCLII